MGDEVVRILRGIAGELSLSGDVLVLGDSTSAYCVDRMSELTWNELRGNLSRECGVGFHFEAWSGATPRAFLNQAENASWRGRAYDWVLLLGGWNSYGIEGGEVETIFTDLFTFCMQNIIRQ